ncbi:MAG: hypothetical protein Q9175_004613 [Cornicularia normoerica]
MQFKTVLSVLSIAIAASALPNPVPQSTTQSCSSPNVEACCDSFATNGTGVGCIFSTLNVVPVCTGGTSLACCNAPQYGLVNVQCVPINVVL